MPPMWCSTSTRMQEILWLFNWSMAGHFHRMHLVFAPAVDSTGLFPIRLIGRTIDCFPLPGSSFVYRVGSDYHSLPFTLHPPHSTHVRACRQARSPELLCEEVSALAGRSAHGVAPHKPMLLLAVLELSRFAHFYRGCSRHLQKTNYATC